MVIWLAMFSLILALDCEDNCLVGCLETGQSYNCFGSCCSQFIPIDLHSSVSTKCTQCTDKCFQQGQEFFRTCMISCPCYPEPQVDPLQQVIVLPTLTQKCDFGCLQNCSGTEQNFQKCLQDCFCQVSILSSLQNLSEPEIISYDKYEIMQTTHKTVPLQQSCESKCSIGCENNDRCRSECVKIKCKSAFNWIPAVYTAATISFVAGALYLIGYFSKKRTVEEEKGYYIKL